MKKTKIVRVYETDANMADKYTLVVHYRGQYDIYTMSENAMSPNGVNMFSHTVMSEPVFSEKEISLSDLPRDVKLAIIIRLTNYLD